MATRGRSAAGVRKHDPATPVAGQRDMPPSITKSALVTKLVLGDARKSTASAISDGAPHAAHRSGCHERIVHPWRVGIVDRGINYAGKDGVHPDLVPASSSAADFVMPRTAHLVAVYANRVEVPWSPASDEMSMIDPPPAFFIGSITDGIPR
jgi:hypothetical protein